MSIKEHDSSGSALIIILIAVILFSALTYAATGSFRGGDSGTSSSEDNARIKSSQIIQYATSIEQSVMKMLLKGTSDTDLSFDTEAWGHSDYQHSPQQPVSNRIFHPQGGEVSWSRPPKDSNDGSPWVITGAIRIPEVGLTCADESCSELVAILPNITKAVCDKLNSILGVSGGQEIVDLAATSAKFTGTYSAGDILGNEAIAPGTRTGCFEGAGGGGAAPETYHFFHVILPR